MRSYNVGELPMIPLRVFLTDWNQRSLSMMNGLEIAIHQFAKRQMTWFRGMERRGFTIHWMNAELPMEEKIAFVKEKLEGI